MDPNANLKEQDAILAQPTHTQADVLRLLELCDALRSWLRGGGFEPIWDDYPVATYEFRLWAKERR